MSGGSPNVIGIEKRLRQLQADHHSEGETAWSTPWLAKLLLPGGNWPPRRQAWSAGVGGEDGWSQLSPLIGITTIEHATVSGAAQRLVLDLGPHLELRPSRDRTGR